MEHAAKLLRRVFAQRVAEALPQFEPQGGVGKVAVPGWRSYLWKVAEDLHFFVCLCVDEAKGEFFVEGAWSDKPDFPKVTASPAGGDAARKESAVRASGLWRFAVNADEAAFAPLIDEALAAVKQQLLPLFVARAAKRGIHLG